MEAAPWLRWQKALKTSILQPPSIRGVPQHRGVAAPCDPHSRPALDLAGADGAEAVLRGAVAVGGELVLLALEESLIPHHDLGRMEQVRGLCGCRAP